MKMWGGWKYFQKKLFLSVVGRFRLTARLQAKLETYATGGEKAKHRAQCWLYWSQGFLEFISKWNQWNTVRWWLRKARRKLTTVEQKHSSSPNVSSFNGLPADSVYRRVWSSLSMKPAPASDLLHLGTERGPKHDVSNLGKQTEHMFSGCDPEVLRTGGDGQSRRMWPSTVLYFAP